MDKAYERAIRLLTRREHGSNELINKLQSKGFAYEEAVDAVKECQRLGYQSDERYVGCMLANRVQKGYGPLRIKKELQAQKIPEHLISQALQEVSTDWFDKALSVLEKKFRSIDKIDYVQLQKMKQYLSYRGYSNEVISGAVSEMQTSFNDKKQYDEEF